MSQDRIVGRLSLHPRGFGFLTPLARPGEDPEGVFVPPPALRGFLAGDLVEARLQPGRDGRSQAADLRLHQRWRRELIGVLVPRKGRQFLRLDPAVANRDWPLADVPADVPADACALGRLDGERLRFVRLVPPEEEGFLRVLVDWGLRCDHPDDVLAEARAAKAPELGSRRDLRSVPTVTIDAPSSRDLDDALAVLPAQPDGAVRVLVSIADVDALVPAGSRLDVEARTRGTSVYLPGRVLPMLPPELSEQALSLLEGEERPALTVELRIDPDGEVCAVDIAESLIRSHARLSYEGVSAYLDQGDEEAVPSVARPTLRWLRAAAGRLGAHRAGRGGISLERDEVRLELDPQTGEPRDVSLRHSTSAHLLVERLMVAANEAVAAWLRARGLPALYRVQDPPTSERARALALSAGNFGFETGFGDELTPRSLAAFEAQFQSSASAPQVRTVLRRVLGRARYDVAPGGHFGLASPAYLHFTSPIRRYADLAVHRIVKAHLRGERDQVAGDPALGELAAELNALAFRATKAEQARRRSLVARLFAARIGRRYRGDVIAVKRFGVILQLAGVGVTGTVAAEALPEGPYRFEPARELLVGEARNVAVGQRLDVEVAGTDEALGRLELVPAPPEKSP